MLFAADVDYFFLDIIQMDERVVGCECVCVLLVECQRDGLRRCTSNV